MKLFNLRNKSSLTFFDSILSIDDLINKSLSLNMEYVSLIEDDVLYGAMEFYEKAKLNGLKPIIGIEIKYEEDSLLLIAKNSNGFNSISKISSYIKSNDELTRDFLLSNNKDVILINLTSSLNHIDSRDFYSKDEIFTKKVTHLEKNDDEARKLFKLVGESLEIDSIDKIDETSHFLGDEDIRKLSNGEQIKNFENLVSKIDLDIKTQKMDFPKFSENSYELLKTNCEKKIKTYLKEKSKDNPNINVSEYMSRTQLELNMIKEMNFSDYFLVVKDYVDWAESKDILVGPGRGSVGGSLVAFLLGITKVDPIESNLLFERFLNSERVSMPDIDIDFQDDRRDEVLNYIREKYGNDNVAQIVTFQTLRAKMSIRDMGRALSYPLSEVDAVSKLIPNNATIAEALSSQKKLRKLVEEDEDIAKLIDYAKKIEGLPRQFSTHAAGIVISKTKIENLVPIQSGYGDFNITQFSMKYLEDRGLIKLDLLGLRNLTIISDVLKKINLKNKDFSLANIPLNDKNTFKSIAQGQTEGIFQLESSGMKKLLLKMKVTNIEDIIASSSLFRPGPQDNIPMFLKGKENPSKIKYLDPVLENNLKLTYGVIVYQEQIMKIVQEFSGFSLSKADLFRKAISKKNKKVIEDLKEEFVKGALANGKPIELINDVYETIEKFANYGFNRSHAYAYSIISYWMSYLKANYSAEFFSSLLSSYVGNFAKIQSYQSEAKKFGIAIKPPSVNHSTDKFIVHNKEILYPLTSIQGFGAAAYRALVLNREESLFKDTIDFFERAKLIGISSSAINALLDSGALNELGDNRQTILNNMELISMYTSMVISGTGKNKIINQEIKKTTDKPKLEKFKDIEEEDDLAQYNSIGIHIKESPVVKIKEKLSSKNVEFVNLDSCLDSLGKEVIIVSEFTSLRSVKTKYGSMMMFGKIEDETGSMSFSVSPRYYDSVFDLIERGVIAILKATVDKYGGGTISIQSVKVVKNEK
ncbi:MAG: DNA polymerase III subunit alpha [Mycoplasmataceae bacterium]|nr:DNA polymerase III subunit alpha [Mycoplasmataceae bacterium]